MVEVITRGRSKAIAPTLSQKTPEVAAQRSAPPEYASVYNLKKQEAARRHADANKSDPFAYARMKLYLDKGYEEI